MNFKTILLFATAFTFALSNSLEITEPENGVDIPMEAPIDNAVDTQAIEAAAAAAADVESEIDDTNEADPAIGIDESNNEPVAAEESDVDGVEVNDDSNASDVAGDVDANETAGGNESEDENVPAEEGQKIDDLDAAEGKAEGKAEDQEKSTEDKDAAEESNEEDEGNGNGAAVAAGLAGAASLASAGIFFWVRKSKRASVQKFSSMNLV